MVAVVVVVGPVDLLAVVTLADIMAMAHLVVDSLADVLDLLALLDLVLLALLDNLTLLPMVFLCADSVASPRRLCTIFAYGAILTSLHCLTPILVART